MRRPFPMLLWEHEVADGGAKEDFRDQETYIVAVHRKSNVSIEVNNRR